MTRADFPDANPRAKDFLKAPKPFSNNVRREFACTGHNGAMLTKIRSAGLSHSSTLYPTLPDTSAEDCMSILLRFWRDEAAATAIEYAIIAVGVSVVIVAAVNGIGTSVKGLFTNVSTSLGNAGQ
jgi:pilus assembly protein Flp/PilA